MQTARVADDDPGFIVGLGCCLATKQLRSCRGVPLSAPQPRFVPVMVVKGGGNGANIHAILSRNRPYEY